MRAPAPRTMLGKGRRWWRDSRKRESETTQGVRDKLRERVRVEGRDQRETRESDRYERGGTRERESESREFRECMHRVRRRGEPREGRQRQGEGDERGEGVGEARKLGGEAKHVDLLKVGQHLHRPAAGAGELRERHAARW